MIVGRKIADAFRLNDKNWMKHTNPWSVWTRYSVLPLLLLAFWSRVWIGGWSILPIFLSVTWMMLNPTLFKKPKSTQNWASKAVLGERVFLNRNVIPIPKHHRFLPFILNVIAGVGMSFCIYAIIVFNLSAALIGLVLAYLGKSWYLDRMVWLFEDMKEHPKYKDWLY